MRIALDIIHGRPRPARQAWETACGRAPLDADTRGNDLLITCGPCRTVLGLAPGEGAADAVERAAAHLEAARRELSAALALDGELAPMLTWPRHHLTTVTMQIDQVRGHLRGAPLCPTPTAG